MYKTEIKVESDPEPA